MITKTDCYILFILIIGCIAYYIHSSNKPDISSQKIKIEIQDSILIAERDSAFCKATFLEHISDSLQMVIDRISKNENKIHIIYVKEKANVLLLDADSSIKFFTKRCQN